MGNINEQRLGETGEPETRAELELKIMMEHPELFSQAFPPGQVDDEINKAEVWEAWWKYHELDAEAEFLASDVKQEIHEQLIYLHTAIFYLNTAIKDRLFPPEGELLAVLTQVNSFAQKFASSKTSTFNQSHIGVLATRKLLQDLVDEGYPQETPLIQVIRELHSRQTDLQKVIGHPPGKKP